MMKTFLRDNGLSITLLMIFLLSTLGMIWSGHSAYNQELHDHGATQIGLLAYLVSGQFLSALFENWESEFLQMSAYVILTAMLFQRGSSESRDPDNPDRPDIAPHKVWEGRPILSWLYSYSLGIALIFLFIISFGLHAWGSWTASNDQAIRHSSEIQPFSAYMFDAKLWFESFQNWQSEFLSTAVLVVLSIFLRHRGSPESKPVAKQNRETGD